MRRGQTAAKHRSRYPHSSPKSKQSQNQTPGLVRDTARFGHRSASAAGRCLLPEESAEGERRLLACSSCSARLYVSSTPDKNPPWSSLGLSPRPGPTHIKGAGSRRLGRLVTGSYHARSQNESAHPAAPQLVPSSYPARTRFVQPATWTPLWLYPGRCLYMSSGVTPAFAALFGFKYSGNRRGREEKNIAFTHILTYTRYAAVSPQSHTHR